MSSTELQTPEIKDIAGRQYQQNFYFNGPHPTFSVHNHPEGGDYPRKTWLFGAEAMQSRAQLHINKPLPIQLVYAYLLLLKGEGYPLWCPQPNSTQQDEEGVQIGDVGVLHNKLPFECLFNIRSSICSSTAGGSDPEGFNRLKNMKQRPTRNWGAYTAHVVPKVGYRPGTPKGTMKNGRRMELSHTFNFDGSHDGAILMLPEGSWQETASVATSQLLQSRAIIHAKRWFQDAEKKLHKPLGGKDFLYLVTGYEKTFSWGISAFVNEGGNPISLTFATHDTGDRHSKYSWNFEDSSLGPGCRCHPDANDPYSESPSSTSLGRIPNQCVFLRGYIITRRAPEDVKITDIVSEDSSRLLFGPEESSSDVTGPLEPLEPCTASSVSLHNRFGDNTNYAHSFNAKHTNNHDSYNTSVDQRRTPGDMEGSLSFEREGSQAAESSSSSQKRATAFSSSRRHQPQTPSSVNYFQQSILERVLEQYLAPFKPEIAMRDLLTQLLGLEPSVIDQWFRNRRVTSKSRKSVRTASRLEKSGQEALLEILMEAWTRNNVHPYPSEDEARSICAAARISYGLFGDWKDRQQQQSMPVRNVRPRLGRNRY